VTGPVVLLAAHDFATAAHRKLASVPGVISALGSSVPPDPAVVWLFVRELQTDQVEGSGKAAAVLREEGAWARPNQHNTARFPRLSLEIFADASRDMNGAVVRRDAEQRARAVWERFDAVLHRVDGFSEIWGSTSSDPGIRVWGSQLMSLPDVYDINDWVGGKRLQCHYGLNTG
jgi:hypothetical protein